MAGKPLSPEEINKPLTPEGIRRRMSYYLHEVGDGHKTARDLTLDEIRDAFRHVFSGACSEAQIAAFLVALRIKGSSDDERFGLLHVLREYNEDLGIDFPDLLDYSGFYDGRDGQLHLAPAIALVAAAAGARVVLTGGRSRNNNTMHRIILQEVLEQLGIAVRGRSRPIGQTLRDLRVGFIDTHEVNRALNNPVLDRIREDIGLRTPINTMEVSLNPANAPYHIRGMFHPGSKEQVARIMARSAIKRGLMLSGIAGSGEIPPFKPTQVFEIVGDALKTFELNPQKLGLAPGNRADLNARDLPDQADKILGILNGTAAGTLRDMTLLNAALILYTSGMVAVIPDGIRRAETALDSKEPLQLLDAWRKA